MCRICDACQVGMYMWGADSSSLVIIEGVLLNGGDRWVLPCIGDCDWDALDGGVVKTGETEAMAVSMSSEEDSRTLTILFHFITGLSIDQQLFSSSQILLASLEVH